jgi:hypothetical protein
MKEKEADLVLVHDSNDEPVRALVRVDGEPVAFLSAAAIKAVAHELHDWEVIIEYRRGIIDQGFAWDGG